MNNNFSKNLLVWVVIVIAAMTVFNMFNPSFNGTGNSMSYSEFLNSVNRGEVAEVKIQDRNITYRTQAGAELSTYAPDDPGLVEHLLNKNVRIDAVAPEEPSLLVSVLMSWFPMILLIGVWIFFMRQMQGGGGKAMSFGRSRARMIDANQAKVTFADVAGVDEAKEELSEVVEFLSNPKKFTRLGRQHILAVHTKKTPIADDVDIEVLAKGTPGFSGADLENLVNEAALQAAKKNKNQLNMSDFEYAKDKVLMGKERRSLVLSEEEKRITAYHEAGHALAAVCLPGSDPVHKVSIIPRGRALGVTMQLPEEDRHGYSKNYLRNNLVVLLAGRMAEELVMDDITTGAGNDIERATKMARKMVCEWGMSDKIGPQARQGMGPYRFRKPIHSADCRFRNKILH